MHAVRERDVSIGQNILIIGAGTIGLGVYLSAKICNPSKIIVADVVDYNLEMARELGCEYTINSMKENLEAEVKKLTNGEGVDITFLAFGNAPGCGKRVKMHQRRWRDLRDRSYSKWNWLSVQHDSGKTAVSDWIKHVCS